MQLFENELKRNWQTNYEYVKINIKPRCVQLFENKRNDIFLHINVKYYTFFFFFLTESFSWKWNVDTFSYTNVK